MGCRQPHFEQDDENGENMSFPEERLRQAEEKFAKIRQKIEYIQMLEPDGRSSEIEGLCAELQEATEEMRRILAQMKQ